MQGPKRQLTLPDEVVSLLEAGDMTAAIRSLLELSPGMNKSTAMRAVMEYRMNQTVTPASAGLPFGHSGKDSWTLPYTLVNLGGFLAFMWMFVNTFVLVASVIILANIDGYREITFRVNDAYYESDAEGGDSWGLRGEADGRELRYSDPSLLPQDDESPGRYMQRMYPPETVMTLLYNPAVTSELFQNRSVNLIQWSPDPSAAEWRRVMAWLQKCLLPFAGFLITSWLMRKTVTTTRRKP